MIDRKHHFLALVGVLATLALAFPASASADPLVKGDAFTLGPDAGWYLMGGITGGGSFGTLGGGGFVGGELSLVRLKQGNWLGLYTDAFYDFGQGRAMLTVGPEIGKRFLGLDGGLGVRFGGDGPDLGGQARLLLTAGLIGIYGRYGIWPGDELEHTGQVGVLIKVPMLFRGN